MLRKIVLLLLAVALTPDLFPADSTPSRLAPETLLTLYSPRGHGMLEVPGRKSWAGHLWLDHDKVGFIIPGQFLTLKLAEGEHSISGEAFGAHESHNYTSLSLRRGEHHFIRLVIDSRAIAGIGPTRWIGEEVTCQEAYSEAAAFEPVKLKRIQKSFVDTVTRESFFPQCL